MSQLSSINPESTPSIQDYNSDSGPMQSPPIVRAEHEEDLLTRVIEQQSAKIPSHVFLFASLGAMAASAILEMRGEHRKSDFVGMWPGPLLILGIYNKIVKTFGAA